MVQVLKLKSSRRPSHYHHHVILFVWCVFYVMLCYFYTRWDGTHTFQIGKTILTIWELCESSPLIDFFFRPSHRRKIFSLFLSIESRTLTLTESCSSSNIVLGSCMTSWMSRWCTLWITLVGRPLLGRFTTVRSLFHLWMWETRVHMKLGEWVKWEK